MGRLTPKGWENQSNEIWLKLGYIQMSDEPFRTFLSESLRKLAHYEDMEEQGRLIELPCAVGDTVYRICPKCNDRHDGSCKNCAWASCMSNSGCTTYGLWGDGQYPPEKCTIVPYKVFWNYIPDLMRNFGKKVFLTKEEAEAKLKELEDGKKENIKG